MTKNPYDILGVNKTATDKEIKSAYRKLAKKYHPDLNPNDKASTDKFKSISSAYDLLKDKELRASFDRGEIDEQGNPNNPYGGGNERQYYRDFKQGQNSGDRYYHSEEQINPEDFADIFGSMFGGRAGGSTNKNHFYHQQNADVHYKLDISFMESALGIEKQVTMPDGNSLKIKIPEGIKNGQKLRLKGKGHKLPNGQLGNAYIEVNIIPHKIFKRDGNDIYTSVPIAIHEAILGASIEVQTIHGSVNVKIPKKTDSGKRFRLKGKGIKSGNHYVDVKIVMPEKIDDELEKSITNWAKNHSYNPRKINGGA